MKNKYIILVALLTFGCNENVKHNTNQLDIKKDTISHEEILYEIKDEYVLQKIYPVKLYYFDKNDDSIDGFHKGDTFHLQVHYASKKFPKLNNSHIINLYPKSEKIKIIKRLDKDKFELYIMPNADTVSFDVFLESNNIIFKSYYLDKNDSIKYYFVSEIGLFKRTDIVKN